MIEHPTWRSLIYRLAEEYPDCLMLNFTIKVKKQKKTLICIMKNCDSAVKYKFKWSNKY